MTTVNYNYVYRGEQKQKVETIEKIHDRLLSMSDNQTDYSLFPKVQFAQSSKDGYTGLIAISLSIKKVTRSESMTVMDILRQQPQVLLTYLDDYSEQLVAVSAYTLPDGTLPQEEERVKLFHERAYFQESQYLTRATNLKLSSGGNDTNHCTILTPDMQKTNIMGRDPYAMAFTDHKRYAAFMATTNSPTPLIDPTGSRRYLCVRTTGKIDNITPIEYDQVYAQLATELQQGERAYFNSEDEAYIQEQNSQYQVSDELSEIFFLLFDLPSTEDEGELLTTSEIVRRMHQYSKAITENRSTYIRMGRLLSSHGVRVKHQKNGNFCRVVCRK